MFTDVEHAHAGARRLDLGNATGTWGFDLVASSAHAGVVKHDVGLRAGRPGRTLHNTSMALWRWGAAARGLVRLTTSRSAVHVRYKHVGLYMK